jgi:hypothetical protein
MPLQYSEFELVRLATAFADDSLRASMALPECIG